MKKTVARPYDWNVICMSCREKIKASTAVLRWDGLVVGKDHPGCFEYRSPLDMPAPPLRDQRPLPFTSPEPSDSSTSIGNSSSISVTTSPFHYTIGTSPEQITFGGTGSMTRFIINGSDIPPPSNIASITFGVGTNLIISYIGTITMTKKIITSWGA